MPKADGKTIAQRLQARYLINISTGCWEWTAGKNGKGYAYIWTGPKRKGDTRQAYKVSWELKYGPIPKGYVLHHACENTLCVNPDHLRLLTHREHQKIGNSPVGLNARKTHCKRGHEFTPENTGHTKSGGRRCLECSRNFYPQQRKVKVGYPV